MPDEIVTPLSPEVVQETLAKPGRPMRKRVKQKGRFSGSRASRYNVALPFYEEYVEAILRPKIIGLFRGSDKPPNTIGDIVKLFKKNWNFELSRGKAAAFMIDCGLHFERRNVLIKNDDSLEPVFNPNPEMVAKPPAVRPEGIPAEVPYMPPENPHELAGAPFNPLRYAPEPGDLGKFDNEV